MNTKTLSIFNQIKQFIPYDRFSYLVGQHQTDRSCKVFSTEKLLSCLLYSQIRGKDSLRDIETCLGGHKYIIPKRSTISYRNNHKVTSTVFEQLFYSLLKEFQQKSFDKKFSFSSKVHILDSTTISLSLGIFDRAKYRKRKWAIKLHTLYDNESYVPELIVITDGKNTDNKVAYRVIENMEKWDTIVFDRWYVDYQLWSKINKQEKMFVTRTKVNTNYCPIGDIPIIDPHILYDKRVELLGCNAEYKWPLRVVRYLHQDDKTWEEKEYEYITNNIDLSAKDIVSIYKNRREIENFFKWIKQNLEIKSFLWCSENAVRNQIRIAMIYYLIILFIAYKARLARKGLCELTRLLSEFCMTQRHIIELLRMPEHKKWLPRNKASPYQYTLF